MMMDNNIQMEIFWRWFRTKSGIFGQLLNAGKEFLQASLFMTAINQANSKESVFASYPEKFY
jgi:hypothetical protein